MKEGEKRTRQERKEKSRKRRPLFCISYLKRGGKKKGKKEKKKKGRGGGKRGGKGKRKRFRL